MKIQKKNFFGGGVGLVGVEVRVCERRIKFFVKIQKKNIFWGGGGPGGSGWWGGVVRVDVRM